MLIHPSGGAARERPLICITGICGFIGSRLAHVLVQRGYDVCGCDNLSTGRRENLPITLQEKRDWIQLDLTDKNAADRLVALIQSRRGRSNRPVHIVHAACPAYDALSHILFTHVTKGVTVGTSVALAAAIRVGAARFILLSSLARYQAATEAMPISGYREEDLFGDPLSPYGAAKRAAELQLRMLLNEHGIPWTILVLRSVFGKGQEYSIPGRNVAACLLNLAIHGKDLPIHGDGSQRRVFTPWSAIEGPMVELCTNTEGSFDGVVLNVGPASRHGMKVRELCTLIARVASEVTGRDLRPRLVSISDAGSTAGARKSAFFDPARYREIFGAEAVDLEPDIEAELTELAQVILARPTEFRHGLLRYHADLSPQSLPEYRARGLFRIGS